MLYPISIVHCKRQASEYVGRGSVLGNLATHLSLGNTKATVHVDTREEAIAWYRRWLNTQVREQNPAVMQELQRLLAIARQQPLALGCWCAPQSCHGEVIRRCLIWLDPQCE